ncbi:MAG TPA: PEP/pyruvate-binding domain-containing protein [Pyrinomonadaceae bacterium]|jgi:pyruvate,water dikinase|nr:PEP/pyruvate-binding domain-containing protein [Pyrinomonadaceae bacterium]
MGRIKLLEQISTADAGLAGGKAYNCARLLQAGFPVPAGFVLLADDKDDGLIESVELARALEDLPEESLFAVRSSAADEDSAGHSFAGIHETRLNVTRDRLEEAIRACRASVESAQAVAYRRAQGLGLDNLRTGVLVQLMIQAVAAGVAFTINPVTGSQDELVISATWGLGEALVGGHVEPDEFRVLKSDRALLSSHIGDKNFRAVSEQGVSRLVEIEVDERRRASLTDTQVRELVGLLVRIEDYYGAPQDIEWCHDGRQFWIVQSRPVTATHATPYAQTDIEWTRANAREVLPDLPSPQVLDAICDILERGMRGVYGRLVRPPEELGPLIKAFYGRPYFNMTQFRHVCRMTGSEAASVMRSMGHEGEIREEDKIAQRPPLSDFLRVLPDILRTGWMQVRAGHMVKETLAAVERDMAFIDAHDPHVMSDEEMAAYLKEWNDETAERLRVVFVMSGVFLYEAPLKKICEQVGFTFERLLHTQLAIGEKSVSAQQGLDLLTLVDQARREEHARHYFMRSADGFQDFRAQLRGTEFLNHFELFLKKYGHRGPYESDWSLPRYSEDPAPLLFAIGAHVQAPESPLPEEIIARQEREAKEAWQEFEKRLSWHQRILLLPRVRWLIKRAKQMYVWRELVRSEMMRPPSALRRWLLVTAGRFVERGWIEERDDFFFLTREEVAEGIAGHAKGVAPQFRPIVARRKAEIETWRELEMPLLMRESELPALLRRATSALPQRDVDELRGLCVSAGSVEGEVLVMREPSEFARMRRGAILVAPATDPAWTPLFTLAAGVIVEVGGTLSHASTVAREYGLPALANVKDATRIFRDGDRVRLDATNGTVRLLSRKLPVDTDTELPAFREA